MSCEGVEDPEQLREIISNLEELVGESPEDVEKEFLEHIKQHLSDLENGEADQKVDEPPSPDEGPKKKKKTQLEILKEILSQVDSDYNTTQAPVPPESNPPTTS